MIKSFVKTCVKNGAKNILLSNQIVKKSYLYYFNTIENSAKSNGIQWGNSFRIKENRIILRGTDNRVNFGEDITIQSSKCYVSGNHNTISIADNACIWSSAEKELIHIEGDNNKIIIEDGVNLRNVNFFVWGNNNLIHIKKGCSITFTGIHIEQHNNSCILEQGCTTHGRAERWVYFELDEGTAIVVDEDCMIANDVVFRSSDSHSVVDRLNNRVNQAADIYIGKHCWIGMRSMILKGVTISNHVIVGAGSVCTKTISQSYVAVAGVPAKIIQQNVDWDRKFV